MQILQILLQNAIKYTRKGKITFKCYFLDEILHSKDKLCIEVGDTGQGFDTKQQLKMFKIFSNFKQKKLVNQGGSGIGLSLCKKLSDLLNIKIHFDS